MELRIPIGLQPVRLYTKGCAHASSAHIRLENAAKEFKQIMSEQFNTEIDNHCTAVFVRQSVIKSEYYYYTLWDNTVTIGMNIHFLKPEHERTGRQLILEQTVKSVTQDQIKAEGIDRLVESTGIEEQTLQPGFLTEEEYQRYEDEILAEQTKPRKLD